MEIETIIIVSVFSAAWLVVFLMAAVLCVRVNSLRKTVGEMQATGKIRVQKLKMNLDKNHAFHNPALAPEEELSRRGYSIYMPDVDVESGRGTTERQTGGQFVEELTREIDSRQQRQSTSPAFQEMDRYSRDMDRQDSRYHRDMEPRQDPRYAQVVDPRQDPRYAREMDSRQSTVDSRHRDFDPRQSDNRQTSAPPFLLQAIEENKRKSRLTNPLAKDSGRQSDTNPNFIY